MHLCNETETFEEHGCYQDEETSSRFQDNEEMRYSLRSVWNFAPWVRNIFVVTNGQIPSWLNLHHPRLHVVPHSVIFRNSSHLPTFSSPAIEANLHRIPGLSEHFVYLNDDVMFGRQVSPSDFYTHGNGQRVYFAWPVPDCAEGCGSAWIGDGYCDVACNVSACGFDNDDCLNSPSTSPSPTQTWSWGSHGSDAIAQCSTGCLDTWIGDRYCDRVCRNPECGMDAGDCGMDLVYQNIDGMDLQTTNVLSYTAEEQQRDTEEMGIPTIHIGDTKRGHHMDYSAVKYFNISEIVGHGVVTESAYSNPSLIRVMTASPKNNVLVILFNPAAESVGIPEEAHILPIASTTRTGTHNVTIQVKEMTNKMEVESSTSTAKSTTSTQGRIFVTFNAKSSSTNQLTEYMFYIQLHKRTSTPTSQPQDAPATQHNQTTPTTRRGDEHDSGVYRSLLSIEAQMEDESESDRSIRVGDDSSAILAKANPKLEEKTLRKVRRLGITQAQIDEERSLLERSARLGIDFLHHPDNPFIVSGDSVSKKRAQELSRPGVGRRLLDHYADSLKHVNNLLNREFGPDARKVPAHMPHYLQKSVLQRMQQLWKREFDLTSSHRTRAGDDMQYSFSYFYYYMNEKVPYDFQDVWEKELDVNRDGVLNSNELRTVAATLLRSAAAYPRPNPRTAFMNWNQWMNTRVEEPTEEPIFQWLRKCDSIWLSWEPRLSSIPISSSTLASSITPDPVAISNEKPSNTVPTSTSPISTASSYEYASERLKHLLNVTSFPREWNLAREQLLNCTEALAPLEQYYRSRLRNRYELGNPDDVAFVMVPTNRSSALQSMDDIRANRNKFVCLNDNINHTDPHSKEVVSALIDFYTALFPLPSPFELPHGETNKFLHTDELYAARDVINHKKNQISALLAIVLLVILILGWVFSRSNAMRRERRED